MTREEYIEIRNTNSIYFELFYEYYTTHCKEPIIKTFEEFIPLFIQFMQNFGINTQLVLEYFDNKFGINKLINIKTQKIIRYV